MQYTNIPQRIRELRIDKRLTQQQLAKALSISNTTLSQYESGKRVPSLEVIIKLARFFKVPIDYVAGILDEKSAGMHATTSLSLLELKKLEKIKEADPGLINSLCMVAEMGALPRKLVCNLMENCARTVGLYLS